MIRMQIQLSQVQLRALRREAEVQGVSQAEVVRRSLDSYLGRRRSPDPAQLRERARALIGAFAGEVGDVSRRHDDYYAASVAHPATDVSREP
jgi:hypothetical protein